MKLAVSFSGYCSSKLYLSIPTNQLAHFVLISMESVSLEDMVGSQFTLWMGTPPLPHHTYLISKEDEEEGGGGQMKQNGDMSADQ